MGTKETIWLRGQPFHVQSRALEKVRGHEGRSPGGRSPEWQAKLRRRRGRREELLDRQKRETERVETSLAQAREQLVRQTRLATIGQMSATIAYELRTPLGTIRNAVQTLEAALLHHTGR